VSAIRFGQRAQQLWDTAGVGLRPEQQQDYYALLQKVKDAEIVIDYTDQVLKDRSRATPRSATLDEIEKAYVV